MERSVSFPNIISDESHSARVVFLECPAALWLITVNLIEEVSLEYGIVGLQIFLLGLVLDVSEMGVVGEIEAFACLKASESFIPLNLVCKGKFH